MYVYSTTWLDYIFSLSFSLLHELLFGVCFYLYLELSSFSFHFYVAQEKKKNKRRESFIHFTHSLSPVEPSKSSSICDINFATARKSERMGGAVDIHSFWTINDEMCEKQRIEITLMWFGFNMVQVWDYEHNRSFSSSLPWAESIFYAIKFRKWKWLFDRTLTWSRVQYLSDLMNLSIFYTHSIFWLIGKEHLHNVGARAHVENRVQFVLIIESIWRGLFDFIWPAALISLLAARHITTKEWNWKMQRKNNEKKKLRLIEIEIEMSHVQHFN